MCTCAEELLQYQDKAGWLAHLCAKLTHLHKRRAVRVTTSLPSSRPPRSLTKDDWLLAKKLDTKSPRRTRGLKHTQNASCPPVFRFLLPFPPLWHVPVVTVVRLLHNRWREDPMPCQYWRFIYLSKPATAACAKHRFLAAICSLQASIYGKLESFVVSRCYIVVVPNCPAASVQDATSHAKLILFTLYQPSFRPFAHQPSIPIPRQRFLHCQGDWHQTKAAAMLPFQLIVTILNSTT
ncbi:hypothetical protein V8C26DRAFT_398940 [Trichoderma gracile]